MTEEVGGIFYEVGMDVQGLTAGQGKAKAALNDLEKNTDSSNKALARMDKQLNSSGEAMGRLSAAASALTAYLSVRQVAQYADEWTVLNNKLANAVRANESLVDVTGRVFDITQSTRSSLDATASLYARLERATRQAGTSTENLSKLTTIINQGFIVSGATAMEAENAIIQLSQGLASGALRGEEFNSVNEQGNRLMVALADSLGVGIGQLRAMAAEGKLTTDVVVNGLLSQGDSIGREFAKTTTTIGQALQVAGNNITKFFGENTTVTAGVSVFNSAVISISENIGALSGVLLATAAVMGSRYVGALTLATSKQLSNAAAAYTAATAQGAFSAATKIAGSALSFIGGPAGLATLAATAIFYYYQKTQQAKQESIDFADKLDGVISKMKEMNSTQLSSSIAKAELSIISQKEAIVDLQKEMDSLEQKKTYIKMAENIRGATVTAERLAEVQREIDIKSGDIDSAQNKLSQTESKLGLIRAELNGQLLQGIELLKRNNTEAGVAEGLMNKLGEAINFASRAKSTFNSSSLQIERPKKVQEYLDKLLDASEVENELNERLRAQLKVEKELRAIGADDSAIKLGRERAGVEYDGQKAQEAKKKAESDANSEAKKSANQAESVAIKLEKMKQSTELATSATENLSREQAILRAQQSLGKGATEENIKLAGEYAAAQWDAAKATQALSLIPALGENQQYRADLQALQAALNTKKIDQNEYYSAVEKREQEHQITLAKIRAEQTTSPVAEARAEVDPIQALANQNAQKLALMTQYQAQEQALIQQSYANGKISYQQFIAAKSATDEQYLILRNAQETQFNQQMMDAQWQLLSQQGDGYALLTDAFDAFAGQAGNALTGILTGSMSVDDALRSLGNTILNSVVNSIVQMGVEWVKNLIIQKTLGVAATALGVTQAATLATAWAPAAALASLATLGANAAPATAGITSTVGVSTGLALSGMRKNGGPVSAGSMYQVGENGLPEIFQASNGRQYMIPGDNGSVISNKDLSSGVGGGVVVYNNITNNSSANVSSSARDNGDGSVTIETIVSDIEENGPIGQAISRNTTANRRATD